MSSTVPIVKQKRNMIHFTHLNVLDEKTSKISHSTNQQYKPQSTSSGGGRSSEICD